MIVDKFFQLPYIASENYETLRESFIIRKKNTANDS